MDDQISKNVSFHKVAQSAVEGIFDIMTADLVSFPEKRSTLSWLPRNMLTSASGTRSKAPQSGAVPLRPGSENQAGHLCHRYPYRRQVLLEECKIAGLTSFAAIPLRTEDTIVGVLGIASADVYDCSKHAALLETAASQIGAGLQNALYYREIHGQTKKWHRRCTKKNVSNRCWQPG
ncbi:MAG: GAF domain-containing protein [Desulfotignum sp.]|nr:GAF domain-containing protein [Desulfotignum sp.]